MFEQGGLSLSATGIETQALGTPLGPVRSLTSVKHPVPFKPTR